MRDETIVARIVDVLARRVVAGTYSPGRPMPSIRRIAEEFEVNRATAQLVLGRLAADGFADAHPRRGFIVRDVRAEGGMETYRRLFRLSMDDPDTVTAMFTDLVAEEQVIVQYALLSYTDSPGLVDAAELTAAVDELESLARGENPDPVALLTAELGLVRRLLTALGYGIQRAVLNSIADMVLGVPAAVTAFYAVSPDVHVLIWRALIAVWESGSQPGESQVALFTDLLGMYHERVVVRFAQLLGTDSDSSLGKRGADASSVA
ncbi:GntR family transcriptional regulator [Nocardia sp. alder85J]|uniref:GntR family transcriptional regulator n=1 Tax=Nocardia sp. alder85J TaxID=2862949 RepID=UPI001CD60480|nr:GntR family transcriptional regulator [Nocardia sp. alder85J]MCX4094670.1 GntR family transcriptional regulator [Nocardia sp. alder85J]